MKILLVRVRGGLCNRLRAMLSGQEWAYRNGHRCHIAWPVVDDFAAKLNDLFLHQRTAPPKLLSMAARLSGGYRDAGSLQMASSGRLTVVSSADVFTLAGEQMDWTERLRALEPSASVVKRVVETATWTVPTVGVMIRADPRSHRVTRDTSRPEWFFKRMNEISDSNPDVRFLLSTDSPMVSKEIHRRFPDVYEQRGKSAYNSREGILDAVADLYLLAGTTYILGSHYSSFSETAALLAGHGGYETAVQPPATPFASRRRILVRPSVLEPR